METQHSKDLVSTSGQGDEIAKKIKTVPHDESDEEDDERQEQEHFKKVLNAYLLYQDYFMRRINNQVDYVSSLPSSQKSQLAKYVTHLGKITEGIKLNYDLCKRIVAHSTNGIFVNLNTLCNDSRYIDSLSSNAATRPSPADMDRTTSVLRQMVREWTAEGEDERNESFGPLLTAVNKYLGPLVSNEDDRGQIKIIVPGAGLGRLPYELASLGYSTQGNEYSMFMLVASHFVLNRCPEPNIIQFAPWVHHSCNNKVSCDQLRVLTMPDVSPTSIPESVDYSMVAGNFIEIYSEASHKNAWDAIVTCFFIDTGHNVLDYIRTIEFALRPGGYWINLGPLLYHFADMLEEKSLELSYDQLREIIESNGFTFLEEDTSVKCRYTSNYRSMLTYCYECTFFVAVKNVNK